ncbi:2-succinyl-6-hydroxy-2,4-cyclohexadiene-1-carboxylate synthase [Oceanobacillus damuensis]|uniref:2-succinyl-6-hydroxy-2, 4-cyclohexadiene-1-carboxylate synthase n=1 Tax=Oceanobacillus damuensis TaxID=937928 RepID=UPI000835C79E|nr:2-succinyl-6-hydroxy-2,4-cyclohexadiene-1-carboxylate synthase [Oceanobacillus damuensis]
MYFSKGDATYWYEIHGKGIPVVMLHGFTGSTATWRPFVEEWVKIGYQVITIDLPGHGKTDTGSPRSMENCCADLYALFQSLELEPFHLLGYSMGGRTALSYAMFYPETVRSLMLESTSPGLAGEEERKVRKENDEMLARKIVREGVSSFVDIWQDLPLFSSQKSLSEEKQEMIRSERLSQSAEGLAESLLSMGTGSQPSWWDQLGNLEKPVLLIVGELDQKFVEINKKMQKQLKSGNMIVCEHAGHAVHVEKPESFDRIVTEFMEIHN